MNERGTYGNGRVTNGHAALGYSGHPVLGADSYPGTRGFGRLLLAMFGGAFVGYSVSRSISASPQKGAALGTVGGFFAHLMMEQNAELRRINQQLAQQP